jgi:hypothetical protein
MVGWRAMLLDLALLGASLVAGVLIARRAGPLAPLVCVSAGIVGCAIIGALRWRCQWRFVAVLRQHEGIVCRSCCYPLSGVQGTSCPECGTHYAVEDLRRYWDEMYPGWRVPPCT